MKWSSFFVHFQKDILLSPLWLCFCVSAFTWQSPDSSCALRQPSRLFSGPFMCLQLSGAGSGARAKAAPTDISAPLRSHHYSWPLTFSHKDYYGFELFGGFHLGMRVSVRACERGMAWIKVIISRQWKNSMRTTTLQGHLTFNTSCEGCLCLCFFVGVCLPLHGLWFLHSHTVWQYRSLTIHRPGKETQSVGV